MFVYKMDPLICAPPPDYYPIRAGQFRSYNRYRNILKDGWGRWKCETNPQRDHIHFLSVKGCWFNFLISCSSGTRLVYMGTVLIIGKKQREGNSIYNIMYLSKHNHIWTIIWW